MWMLSVAAALVGPAEEVNSAALVQLEEAVRAVPGLGEALDAGRAGNESDRIRLAVELANGLKAAYDGDSTFSAVLDAVWPEVLFGPKARRMMNVHTGVVTGTLIQVGVVGAVTVAGPPSSARSRFPFFGRRAKKPRA
ncbi:MAG TPA: hypothetical protein VF821_19350 [Lentzea sp.]